MIAQESPRPNLSPQLLRLIESQEVTLSEMTTAQRWRLYEKLKEKIVMSDDVRTPQEYERRIKELVDYLEL